MKLLPVKIVCRRCLERGSVRLLARYGPDSRVPQSADGDERVGIAVRRWTTFESSPTGESRMVSNCPKCAAHIVVKVSTIRRRVDAGETLIDV